MMNCILMDGKKSASGLYEEIKQRSARLSVQPCLAVVLVGNDPASAIYVRNKEKAAKKAGIGFVLKRYEEGITTEQLKSEVSALAEDENVHGIIVQLPLPAHIDEEIVLSCIPVKKDADGFSIATKGRLIAGDKLCAPCTPAGCMRLLKDYGIDPDGKTAVVIGRSDIVGKPLAMLLTHENATVTLCHSHTRDIARFTSDADIVAVAVGKPGFLTADMIKEGAVILDIGINRLPDGTITGDADPACREKASYLTPVPGGVGPMTVAMLLERTLRLAEAKSNG